MNGEKKQVCAISRNSRNQAEAQTDFYSLVTSELFAAKSAPGATTAKHTAGAGTSLRKREKQQRDEMHERRQK